MSADLLACFPTRTRLALMPKPICSPSRPSDVAVAEKRHISRSVTRGHASPMFNTKAKDVRTEISEPTSPKVTCAGQIKVRPNSTPKRKSCDGSKNWQSVKEEIERIHHQHKHKPHWLETLGFKKEAMQFIGAFRGLRFNMQCFGSFPGPVECSSDDDDDGEVDGEDDAYEYKDDDLKNNEEGSSTSATLFSKLFMVLEENQVVDEFKKQIGEELDEEVDENCETTTCVPPPNALLLMRCRSAPSKGLLKRGKDEDCDEAEVVTAKMIKDDEKEKERLLLMSYAPDFFKLSTDIAKETWVVGSLDSLLRSRSWKR